MGESSVPGARNLLHFKMVELGWSVLNVIFWQLAPRLFSRYGVETAMSWTRISGIVGLLFFVVGFALLIPFAQGRRGTGAASPAQAAMVLFGIALLLDLVFFLPELGGGQLLAYDHSAGIALSAVRVLATVAADVCFWVALVRTSATTLTPAYFGALSVSAALSLMSLLLPSESYRKIIFQSSYGPALHWVRFAAGLTMSLLTIALLRQVVRAGASGAAPSARVDDSVPAGGAARDLLIGGLFLAVGLVVTVASYSAASSGGGGRYYIASGAIAVGLVRLIRGLVRLSSS